MHCILQRIESYNGPPFNSKDFKLFAKEMGFKHHKVTPEHPRANGEAESFMKVLNKTEQIASSEGKSSNTAIQCMLMGYRSTPHPATGYTPYEALMKRIVRTKLDYDITNMQTNYKTMEREITIRDKEYKQKWEDRQKQSKYKRRHFEIGDKVLLWKRKVNKWSTAYEKEHYEIIEICGSSVKARRKSDGRIIRRDASKFKLLREYPVQNWREAAMLTRLCPVKKHEQCRRSFTRGRK